MSLKRRLCAAWRAFRQPEPPAAAAFDLEALDEAQLQRLAERLGPHAAQVSLRQPRIWGDPARLQVGQEVHLVDTLFNTVSGRIEIEDYVFFGHGCAVLTGTHDIAARELARQGGVPTEGRDVHIGRGAWIASGAVIAGPARVGAHAVIAAGSLLIGDAEPGWLYAGRPARKIRPV